MREHLRAHAHGTATTADFAAALAAAAGADVSAVLRSFVEQPGVPMVTAELRCGAGPPRVGLTQRRMAAESGELWHIPFCFRHGVAGREPVRECLVLSAATGEHTLGGACPDWVAWNAGNDGYYLVAQDAASLANLVRHRARLGHAELLGLLADARNLAVAGLLPLGEVMRVTAPLGDRPHRDVESALVDLAIELQVYAADGDREAVGARLLRRHGKHARALGVGPQPRETVQQAQLRRWLFGTIAGYDPWFARDAEKLTRRWLADPRALEPREAWRVLAVAANHGDRGLFDAYRAAALALAAPHQEMVFGAMAQFRDPDLVRELFALAAAPEIQSRALVALGSPPRGPNRALHWQLLEEHADALLARLPDDLDAALLRNPRHRAPCTDDERALWVRAFGERAKALKNGPQTYAETLSVIDRCIAVRKLQAPNIAAWLRGP